MTDEALHLVPPWGAAYGGQPMYDSNGERNQTGEAVNTNADTLHDETDLIVQWTTAIADWRTELVAVGRTPKTVALWIRAVRRVRN